jgi:hypothetical protein
LGISNKESMKSHSQYDSSRRDPEFSAQERGDLFSWLLFHFAAFLAAASFWLRAHLRVARTHAVAHERQSFRTARQQRNHFPRRNGPSHYLLEGKAPGRDASSRAPGAPKRRSDTTATVLCR